MLRAYLPVLVFLALGAGVGLLFTFVNRLLGPRRPSRIKREPYECGLPSEVTNDFRFGVSYYQVGMLFILFDIEVVLLYPVAIVLGESVFALAAIGLFIFLLAVAYVFEWNRGTLDWAELANRRDNAGEFEAPRGGAERPAGGQARSAERGALSG